MISVCIATFNGEKYISAQMESILSQLSPVDEVIVSDDGSTDSTLEIIHSFNDSRVRISQNKRSRGYTNNFESALEQANGDIIFLSDQDDIWHPNKIELSISKLIHCDFVISDAEVVDMNLSPLHESYFKIRNSKIGLINNLFRCRYLGSCYAFKKNVLDKALPFPSNSHYIPHDYWLILIGSAYFRVKIVNKPLIKYRRHSSNTSNGGEISSNSIFKKIRIRLYVLIKILQVLNK